MTPVLVRVRRCSECRGVILPWQDVVREFEPECCVAHYHHHSCHHARFERMFSEPDDEPDSWKSYLACEHRTMVAA